MNEPNQSPKGEPTPLLRANFRTMVDSSQSVSANNVVSLYIDSERDAVIIIRVTDPANPTKPTKTIVPMTNVASYWEDESKKPVALPKTSKRGSNVGK